MELKFVVPNMAQTFGNLEFAGEMKSVSKESMTEWQLSAVVIICTLMCSVPMIL